MSDIDAHSYVINTADPAGRCDECVLPESHPIHHQPQPATGTVDSFVAVLDEIRTAIRCLGDIDEGSIEQRAEFVDVLVPLVRRGENLASVNVYPCGHATLPWVTYREHRLARH